MSQAVTFADMQPEVNLNGERSYPEKRLWAGVLYQAVHDAKALYKQATKSPKLLDNVRFVHEVKQLKRYFTDCSMEIGGLGFICLIIDTDAKRLGDWVLDEYFSDVLEVAI
ncbi:MAG: hypothetical protein HN790_05335 [Methylococcales bacterium]|jgi:hypothetical protein|nr:hypothetical protein [Methylococcales bacterium]